MSDEHHEWHLNNPPPTIRAHSIAKHRVLSQYLARYVEVLTSNLRIPQLRLTLVDGFAGGGVYLDWKTQAVHYGSPLLMLRAMQEAAVAAQEKRSKEFHLDVEYFFIEESKPTFDFLKYTLSASEFAPLLYSKVNLLNDTFQNRALAIIDQIRGKGKKHRAIFLLDQFGYKDVPFPLLRLILKSIPNAEIILTFATDWLINFLSESDSTQQTLQKVGLDLSKDAIKSAKQYAHWRRLIQFTLHQQIYIKSGARHFTPFFIRSKDAHNDYWLIHLSNHSRARDVMVGLHWIENKSFAHFGRPGLRMLGYDQDFDTNVTGQKLLLPEFRFDKEAQCETLDSLAKELPERLHSFKDGISFDELFSLITNETPATSELIRVALARMRRDGVVVIRDKTKTMRRQSGIQDKTDVISPSPQRLLFLPN